MKRLIDYTEALLFASVWCLLFVSGVPAAILKKAKSLSLLKRTLKPNSFKVKMLAFLRLENSRVKPLTKPKMKNISLLDLLILKLDKVYWVTRCWKRLIAHHRLLIRTVKGVLKLKITIRIKRSLPLQRLIIFTVLQETKLKFLTVPF